ncbi:hypothetical protein MNBD_UNCLBAC01-188 [hydrothermal vent metagenome]|uniref:Sporulation stage II protein D amidase enhancer LytB N-terminal domain-containing protein n=1 Tax=hydrothermal vent metagenome TaxID=652676 RepID=A0A3B1E0H0_9ZZZZ
MLLKKFLSFSLLLFIFPSILHAGFFSTKKQPVRIAILKNRDSFVVSVRGTYRIIDPLSKKEIFKGRRLRKSRVIIQDNGIHIGRQFYAFKRLQIIAKKDVTLYAKGKHQRYRGIIDIQIHKNKLMVINVLPLEAYIRGVLYHEVPHKWPLEVIKAQAVAARTYALYRIEQNKNQFYDVTSDIYSQVYGGRSAERHRTNIAADRTRGEVLMYKGRILPTYFHSTCGGHTEDVRELWKHDLEPLYGAKCDYCRLSPIYSWKKNFQSKEIQEKLNQQGYKVGLIEEIKILSKNKSGRIKMLKITDRDGKVIEISGIKFRSTLGPNNLKSNFYDIEMKGYYFDVIGNGWGHGVGMCQWGAHQMAQERLGYKKILGFYYPGSKIHRF